MTAKDTTSAAASTVVVLLPMVDEAGIEVMSRSCADVRVLSRDEAELTDDQIAAGLADADAIVSRVPAHVDARVLDHAPNLRVISGSGAGIDTVDVAEATRRGLPVLYVPGVGAPSVIEYTIGALVVAGRQFLRLNDDVREMCDWSRRRGDWSGVELREKTLGLLGLGNIGRGVAERALAGLLMKVIAYDPLADPQTTPCGVELVDSPAEVVARADFLSLHIPLTETTRGLVDAAMLATMKPGAHIVCTARGGIVDEAAVAEALRDGRLRSAVFDVFADEPQPSLSPLVDAPNCLMTPHIAGLTDLSMRDLCRAVGERVVSALDGVIDPSWLANPEVLDGWCERGGYGLSHG